MKKVFCLILALSLVIGTLAMPAMAADAKVYGYDNLNNEAGELVIGFLGGSITVADGDSNSMGFNRYATRVTNWFQNKYPAKTVKQVNAGIGGTGSDLGKYRVKTDIGAYAPDVVFVEYAVNDAHYSALYSETVRSNMETIVRTLQSLPKVPVIVFLYSMHDNSYSNIRYTSISDHQEVADYYGIESINFYEYMSELVEKGDFVWSKGVAGSLTNDNIHPNAKGHEQYGNYIISQLESRNILHKNKTGLSRKFMLTTKDTRDIKFDDAEDVVKTGTWENAYSGQSDNKYEAIQSTAAGDSISFTYTSAGNDAVGVTVLGGAGTFVVDEGTENEISGQLSGSNNLPVPKEFASALSAGKHTVKIVNTGDGSTTAHLKIGRIIANGGVEVSSASADENGDHIPGTMPENLIISCQVPGFHSDINSGNVSYDTHKGDYTSNNSHTVRQLITSVDLTAGGSWGCYGFNFARATETSHKGILYDNYTAKAGTYVFKARVRALSGNPTLGATTVKNWKGSYDNEYGSAGYAPGEQWSDYKATLSPAEDGFTLAFGHLNSKAGDGILLDSGDSVYFAPEEAYDVAIKTTGEKNEIIAGGKNTYKAEVLNQIGITAKSVDQQFTWSVVDENGNVADGFTVTPALVPGEATVNVDVDVPFGTYYLRAVSNATNWQKTLAIEVIEGPVDPFARDYVPGEMPENKVANGEHTFWTTDALTDAKVSLGGTTWINGANWAAATITALEDITTVSSWYGSAGVYINGKAPKINLTDADYPAGEHAVVMFAARNTNTEIKDVKLRMGIWKGTWSGTTSDFIPVQEYPDGTVTLPNDGSWEIIKVTLPERAAGTAPSLRMGLPVGSVKDTKVELNAAIPNVQKVYYAKEVPHSVALESVGESTIPQGEKAQFKAQLLNQLGITGYLDQNNVVFSVGDDKNNPVEGLTVTAEGAIATVSATDKVPEGEYYLRADYTVAEGITWRKTLAITVGGAIANTGDYVVGEMPENLFANPKNSSLWYTNPTYINSTTVQTKNEWASNSYAGYAFKTTDTVTSVTNGWQVAAGSRLLPAQFADYTAKEGENYVIRFAARSLTENTGFGVRIGTWNGLYSGTAKDVSQIMGYENGVAYVPGDGEWHTIKGTLPALRAGDINGGKIRMLVVGMAAGTPTDVTMELNNHYKAIPDDVPYFAKEVPYDIKVNGDSASVSAAAPLGLEAEILNQIGTKGALNQSFDWVAVTEDRLSYVDGITFTPSNDGAKVTVKVADTVAAGDYIIVAQNKAYGMNRQYPITVTEATYDVTDVQMTVTDSDAIISTLSVNTDKTVVAVLAAYRGENYLKSTTAKIESKDGKANLEETLVLFELEPGDKVRLFVWDAKMVPFTMSPEFGKMVTIQ